MRTENEQITIGNGQQEAGSADQSPIELMPANHEEIHENHQELPVEPVPEEIRSSLENTPDSPADNIGETEIPKEDSSTERATQILEALTRVNQISGSEVSIVRFATKITTYRNKTGDAPTSVSVQ